MHAKLVTSISTNTADERIAFYHSTMLSPTISVWFQVIDAGHITIFPHLTPKKRGNIFLKQSPR